MMIDLLASLAISSVSVWVSAAGAEWVDKNGGEARETHVVVLGDGDAENNVTAVLEGDDAQEKKCVVLAKVGEGRDDGRSEKQVVSLVSEDSREAEEHAWLGVSIGAVSDSHAADGNLDEKRTLILNVVKDSPADRAGLKEHDVILSIGGEETDGDIGRVVELISSRRPGDEVAVVALREGEEKSLLVTLGSRAEVGDFQWKRELEPLGEMKEKIRAHLRVLRPDDEGALVLEELGDLGDLEVLENLPESIRAFIPKSDDRTVRVWLDKDHKKLMKIMEKTDGRSLEIEQEDDGDIVVRRTDENGDETATTYADEETLKAGDEEAYEAFQHADHPTIFKCDIDLDGIPGVPQFKFEFDSDEWRDNVNKWRSELEEHLGDARQAHQEAMRSLHEAIEQWKSGKGPKLPHAIERLPDILNRLETEHEMHPFARARYTFHVDEDGKIEARLRKGDSEIVRTFASEEDLADRDAELYEKYKTLLSEDEP